MFIKDAVVERFKEICKQRKIKYNKLATLSDVTPSTIYNMLDNSRRDIFLITVKKLCDGLDMSIADFFKSEIFENLEKENK